MGTPTNQSVVKAFVLLQSFKAADEWLTSAELSRRARLPLASGYRIVQTLEEIGAIVRDARGRYRPGLLLLDLSQDIVAHDIWAQASGEVIRNLSEGLGLTVHVGTLDDSMVTYVAKAGPALQGMQTQVGAQLEAYCTAIGKVLLAALPQENLMSFLEDGELVPLTERTITERPAFLTAIGRVRAQGFAFDDRETLDDLRCLAAPIRNQGGKVVGAISISDDAGRMGEERHPELTERLFRAAQAIGARLYRKTESRRRPRGQEPDGRQLAGA